MKIVELKSALGRKEQRARFARYGEELTSSNLTSFKNISILGVGVGAVLTVLSLPFVGVLQLFHAYFMLFALFLLSLVVSIWVLPRRPALVLPSYYGMMVLFETLAIYMGTVLGPDTNATTFLLGLLLFPLFVTDYPWRLILTNFFVEVGFVAAALLYKPRGQILSLDLANSVAVFLLGAIFVVRSVQRQLQSVENLEREKDELLRKNQLVNAIPIGIAVFEVHGSEVQQVYTNDSFYRLFEDTREARAERNGGNFLNGIYPDDRPKLMKAMKSVIDGKNFVTMACRSMKGDGSYLWVRFASSVDYRKGDDLRVYSTYSSMEEEMKSREATQAKTEFLSRMSHDMRTPMNGILGLAALSAEEENVAVLRDNIRRIQESGDYLLSLINDTLDFQRIESGKMVLDVRVVKAQTVFDSVMDVIGPSIVQKKINFQVINENDAMDWYIRIDAVRVQQILINLFSNAVKFTPEGGRVTFSVGSLSQEGRISHDYFRISDTGIGMSAEFVQKRLFQPFSQESSTVSPQYVGSGLGLSIVNSLIELMGGHIEVESTPGVGTTFTVYLDVERVERVEAESLLDKADHQLARTERLLGGKKILLAEDHSLNAEIVQRMLNRVGCETIRAKNGQECVDLFERSAVAYFDAILMDVRMPVLDGQDATRAIRRLERGDAKTVPILAITANAYEDDIRNCLDAGMNAHLAKPINMNQLYQTLCDFVESDGPTKGMERE